MFPEEFKIWSATGILLSDQKLSEMGYLQFRWLGQYNFFDFWSQSYASTMLLYHKGWPTGNSASWSILLPPPHRKMAHLGMTWPSLDPGEWNQVLLHTNRSVLIQAVFTVVPIFHRNSLSPPSVNCTLAFEIYLYKLLSLAVAFSDIRFRPVQV